MTKEELKKEAKSYAKRKFDEEEQAYLHDIIAQTYLDGAEPREKRIEELENKIADIKANCDLAIEGRDIKIKELELELTVEKDLHQEEVELHLHAEEYIKELEKQVKDLEWQLQEVVKDNDNYQVENKRLEQQIEKMKRHCNCKHRDSEGYCEVKRTYLMDLSYDGCDKWELED